MQIVKSTDGFKVVYNDITLIEHSAKTPCVFIGTGCENIDMYRGNYNIKDEVIERIGLRDFKLKEGNDAVEAEFSLEGKAVLTLSAIEKDGRLNITAKSVSGTNRLWLRLCADKDEKVFGCGEQFSYVNLRGKNFPIWTQEQGVGRNKATYETFLADTLDKAGGDYHTTFFPQATFVSSRLYYCHSNSYIYQDLDFSHDAYHELQIWAGEASYTIEAGKTYIEVLERLTALIGRQPALPDWAIKGSWLGVQGGTKTCLDKLKTMEDAGTRVSAVWAQDWQGIKMTSFGKRLNWDWIWNPQLYPGLDEEIVKLREKGIGFMGYINPYVLEHGTLYKEAVEKGLLAKNKDGDVYLVDFGEFDCGIVDFTDPAAFEWYKNVIKRNFIEFGLIGWMADFGEYLPTDAVLKNGDAMAMHNEWPALWAKVNYEALEETGNLGKLLYYMRAGAAGSQKYSTLMWAGDQNVDWSLDDGLASVVNAALSMGMTGHGYHTSDIGGYTTLWHMKRSKELFMRWAEFCAFTPVMRTHEGNRPDDNWQFDSDRETIEHFARFSQVHEGLFEYMKAVVLENAEKGTPCMRPLFMHYEGDLEYGQYYEYLLGRDMLVAPIYIEGATEREVYLPNDNWVHLWDKTEYTGGKVTVAAPRGKPPVFYRKDSAFVNIFEKLKA